jgi:hypothetical protein
MADGEKRYYGEFFIQFIHELFKFVADSDHFNFRVTKGLNAVLLTEIRTSSFCAKKFSWKRDTVQGEKAGHIPQLLRARAEEVEVVPTAKNSHEVTCVYSPP